MSLRLQGREDLLGFFHIWCWLAWRTNMEKELRLPSDSSRRRANSFIFLSERRTALHSVSLPVRAPACVWEIKGESESASNKKSNSWDGRNSCTASIPSPSNRFSSSSSLLSFHTPLFWSSSPTERVLPQISLRSLETALPAEMSLLLSFITKSFSTPLWLGFTQPFVFQEQR